MFPCLDTGAAFGGDLQGVLKQILQREFEPAIWLRFRPGEKSKIFSSIRWFVKDSEEALRQIELRLVASTWSWYVLDGTHP